MPNLVTPARRSREQSFNEDEDAFITPPTSRRRLNNERGSLSKVPKEHQPGAIVRVKLINFVTYSEAEFEPGPSLNMVIGPNGNGKSTLVCAICLGLGWSSQHLGRAKDVGDFVKYGHHKATIEIELKKDGVKYTQNPVITAIITKDDNSMKFLLNGRQSSKKACQNIAKSFSIQIDNLCQFLPQDRVVEFAAMSPVELLKSTQRAIASEEMIEWHDQLIELNKNALKLGVVIKEDNENLKNLEARQRMQETDVQRLREREAIKVRISHLEKVRIMVEYMINLKKHRDLREQVVETEAELVDLRQRVEPALRSVNAKEAYATAIETVRDHRNAAVTNAEISATEKKDAVSACQRKIKYIDDRYEERVKDMRGLVTEIKRLEGIIRGLRIREQAGPPEFDLAEMVQQIRELARNRGNITDETKQLKSSNAELNEQITGKTKQVKETQARLQNLDSLAGQREQILKRVSQDTHAAWEWIQRNQDRFQQPILGPPIVTCSVVEQQFPIANMLESAIQVGDLIALTAQSKDDGALLHKIIKDELRLQRVSTRVAASLDRLRSPMLEEEVRALGFTGWAKNYIQGPPGVVAMLCEAANLHRTAICDHPLTDTEFSAAQQTNLAGWISPVSTYRVMRRAEYGAGAQSITVRGVKKAQFWTDQPVDSAIKDGLRAEITELERDIVVMREEFESKNKQILALSKKYSDLQHREKELTNEKDSKLKEQTSFQGIADRIQTQEQKLEDDKTKLAESRQILQNSQDERDQVLLDKGRASIEYMDAVLALQKTMSDLQEVEIMLIEADSDVKVLQQDNIAVKQQLEDKQKTVAELKRLRNKARDDVRALQAPVQALSHSPDDALRTFVEGFDADNKTLEQHDIEIESEKNRLELIHGGNAGAIKQYEEREKQINAVRNKLVEIETAYEEVAGKLTDIRNRWEPRLDTLVKQISSSFSHNMGQINCNGSVEIDKNEDFEQWAIQIFVRFREGEAMTRLDSHRQSGGERAVSTIFYLMSLQTLTRSPFRVVDEINQGMDPRNERLVHSRMVAIATGNDDWQPTEDIDMDSIIRQVDVETADLGRSSGSQYFLITPKLLHDLRYEEGMKILCIASGEHLKTSSGEPSEKISFQKSLRAHKTLAMRTAVAA